jgi:hypothetical protein
VAKIIHLAPALSFSPLQGVLRYDDRRSISSR